MKISNKFLGIAGIIAAPFLGLEMSVNGNAENTSLGGLFDLIYMLGWMCSIFALMRMKAAGEGTSGNVVLYIQIFLLSIANIWNIWVMIDPNSPFTLFLILDFFWPLSNLFMIVTGIAVAISGKLEGWRRWTALLTGLWLPFSVIITMLVLNNTRAMNISITYSVVAWSLLGLSIATTDDIVYAKRGGKQKWRPARQPEKRHREFVS